jgi:hypothetical protein
MNLSVPWNKALFAGFAVLCLIASMLAVMSLDGALVADARGGPLPVAAGFDQASDLLIASTAVGAAKSRDLARARDFSWAALRQAPGDTGAWLRLAEIDSLMAGQPQESGLRALRNSYRVAPLDPYQAYWRTRFALENWPVLPGDIRQSVDQEVAGLAASPPHRENLARTLEHIESPQGSMVAALLIYRYRLPPPPPPPPERSQ